MVRVQRRPKILFLHPDCLSFCASFSSRKYSSNVFQSIYGIQAFCSIFCIENDLYEIHTSYTHTNKKIKRHYCQRVKL